MLDQALPQQLALFAGISDSFPSTDTACASFSPPPNPNRCAKEHLDLASEIGYAMRSSLEDIPDEIIRHILLYLPPEDTLESFQFLSRRYHHLANESLLWRWHCRGSFRHWNPEHNLSEKLAALASSVDWRGLWITRKRKNDRAARLLDGVIATKVGQLSRMQGICELGYDVKDYLLEQCRADDSAEDVLARR